MLNNGITNKQIETNLIWKKLFEIGILSENQSLHYKLKFEGSDKEFTEKAIATKEGIKISAEEVKNIDLSSCSNAIETSE